MTIDPAIALFIWIISLGAMFAAGTILAVPETKSTIVRIVTVLLAIAAGCANGLITMAYIANLPGN